MSAMRPIITVGQPHIAGTIDLFRVECLALRAQKRGIDPCLSTRTPLALREWGLYALCGAALPD